MWQSRYLSRDSASALSPMKASGATEVITGAHKSRSCYLQASALPSRPT